MGMKVAVLFSGGKDSTFTTYQCLKKGYDVRYLVTMIPENPHSYMFHHPNVHLTALQAKSMGIDIITKETKGEKERELADMRKALLKVRGEVDGIVAGGLASKYQVDRVGKICHGLGLKVITPIWGINPEKYWRILLKSGFEIIIVAVSAEGLGQEWLGRKIDMHAFKELKTFSKKFGFHLGFEGGEAETFVINSPVFRKRIKIIKTRKEWYGDSGVYIIEEAKLINK